jgi:dipeptidyl aminopeptidase/acylaminoacyl peptidase
MDSPKYAAFNVTSTTYKSVNGQEIPLSVFIPKALQDGKRPLLVHLHGGFLLAGHALYPDVSELGGKPS